jgi:hypothetical protein
LLLRYLFGLEGQALVQNVTAYGSQRTSADDIQGYIEKFLPQ